MKKYRLLHNSRIPFALASAIAAMLTMQAAHAVNYYWDTNSTTAGFGSANGTWDSSVSANWTTDDVTGVAAPAAVTTATGTGAAGSSGDNIFFGTNTVGQGYANGGSATVTVSGTQNAGQITFGGQTGAITFTGGGTLNLTTSSLPAQLVVNAGAGAVDFGNTNFTSGNSYHEWQNNSSNLLKISGTINAGGNQFSLAGSGSGGIYLGGVISNSSQLLIWNVPVTFGAANNYTGTTSVNSGTLILDTNGQAGAAASSILDLRGGTLQTISTSTKTIANRTYIDASSTISGGQSITFSANKAGNP